MLLLLLLLLLPFTLTRPARTKPTQAAPGACGTTSDGEKTNSIPP
jgi:hypothetical protein